MFIRRRIVPILAAIAVLHGTSAIAGIRVQPMSYDLGTSGSDAQQDLRVENTGDRPLPVELRVERRQILPDGTEKRTPAEDDFLVFPPQGIVPPNGFQTFRVRYIGAADITKSKLYTITVAQLPVEMDKSTGVQLLFDLGTLAAVSPAGSKPDLVVTKVAPGAKPDQLQITVQNTGNRYARLREGKWTFTSADGKSETLEGTPLGDALKQPLIEPGTTRVIDLPVGANFDRAGAKASFQYTGPGK